MFELAGRELAAARMILDIGCGTGWWLERLAADERVTASLHGIEILDNRAESARQRVPHASISVADACELPYDDRSFDVVTMFTVLSSCGSRNQLAAMLREARRVTSSHGAMLVWEPRLPNPLNRNTVLVDPRPRPRDWTRVRSRTTTVLPPLARRLGRRTDQLYPLLAGIPLLRTHRLTCVWI